MRARRILITLSSLAVVAAGLTLAPSASAKSAEVQEQSYQRASQSEACAAQTGETPWQAAWGTDSSWHPTWEQWANGGTGGWTCTRSITWATGIGCVQVLLGDLPDSIPVWADFGFGYSLPAGMSTFADAGCTQPVELLASGDGVWAADPVEADARCNSVWPDSYAFQFGLMTPNAFACLIIG